MKDINLHIYLIGNVGIKKQIVVNKSKFGDNLQRIFFVTWGHVCEDHEK